MNGGRSATLRPPSGQRAVLVGPDPPKTERCPSGLRQLLTSPLKVLLNPCGHRRW